LAPLKDQDPGHQKKQVAQRPNHPANYTPLPKGPNDPPNPQEMWKNHQKKKVEYKDKKREIYHSSVQY
jgi:hypothetical protein